MHRLCAEAGCPRPATYRGRCASHNRLNDKTIKRRGRHVYATKRWRALRARKLERNPICERCGNYLATDVHHLHGITDDPYDPANLEALCHACHSRITRADQVGRVKQG